MIKVPATERSPSQQLSQSANWDAAMAGNGAISKLGILAALLDPEALNGAQDTSIFSRQDSPVLVFREESSAKQRGLGNLAPNRLGTWRLRSHFEPCLWKA